MILEARGLRVQRGDRVLIDGLDLRLEAGEIVAVNGPSGSGKSSLLRALADLDPHGGSLSLGGRDRSEFAPSAWRARVRYVPQSVPGLSGTPSDTARLLGTYAAAPAAKEDPKAIARAWQLPAERWDQPWSELSGGEQQRALLALALATPADVLLLDEPTSALDPEATAAVEASLRGRTALWITHDPDQAARVGSRTLTLGAT